MGSLADYAGTIEALRLCVAAGVVPVQKTNWVQLAPAAVSHIMGVANAIVAEQAQPTPPTEPPEGTANGNSG